MAMQVNENVAKANRDISHFLSAISRIPDDANASEETRQLTQLIEQIGADLAAARGQASDKETQQALGRYRKWLERLESAVKKLHIDLIVQRAELDKEEQHLRATSLWMRSYQGWSAEVE